MFVVVTLLSMLFSFEAILADEVGNGGDAIVCRSQDGIINSAKLLDYYEGEHLYSLVPRFNSPQASRQSHLDETLAQLENIDFLRAQRYRKTLEQFDANAHYWPGVELVDIPDSNHLGVPRGCHIEQVAIQKAPTLPGERLYTISKDIWDRMSPRDQAGLMLHEVIFREALSFGHVNSKKSRYFNAFIAATDGKMTAQTYSRLVLEALGLANVSTITVSQGGFHFGRVYQFHENGLIAKGLLITPQYFYIDVYHRNFWIKAITFTDDGRIKKVHLENSEQKNYIDGCGKRPHLGALDDEINLSDPSLSIVIREEQYLYECMIHTERGAYVAEIIPRPGAFGFVRFSATFSPEGLPKLFVQHEFAPHLFKIRLFDSQLVWFRAYVEFHANGEIRKSILDQDTYLYTTQNVKQLFKAGTELEFDEMARVL